MEVSSSKNTEYKSFTYEEIEDESQFAVDQI
jgi:hypothetical protein